MAKKKQKAKVKASKPKATKVSATKSLALPAMPKLQLKKLNLPKVDRKKVLVGLAVVAALAFLYFFKGLFVAAVVDGHPISRFALIHELEKQDGSQVLSALVSKQIVAEEARKNNIVVTQADIDAEISKIETTIKSQGQTLDDALASQGWTRADLEDQVKTQIIVERILADKVKVSDQEIDDYIKTTKSTDSRDNIATLLKQQKLTTEYQTWIAGLMAKAKVEYWVKF